MGRTINEDIEKAVDSTLGYLSDNGIDVPEPSVVYTGKYCPINNDYIAMARGEVAQLQGIMSDIGYQSWLPVAKEFYRSLGISLSDEALMDYFLRFTERLDKLTNANEAVEYSTNLPADIVVFKALPELARKSEAPRNETMARIIMHEMWHYVQSQTDMMSTPVCEGEAEAARTFFERDSGYERRLVGISREEDRLKSSIGDMAFELLYMNGLRIVRRHSRSVKTLHEPEVRKKTERDFIQFLRDHMERQSRKALKTRKIPKASMEISSLVFPEIYSTGGDLDAGRYLQILEEVGFNEFLGEIRDSDLTYLLEYIREVRANSIH